MSQKYIYQISNLTKKIGQREILKEIWLAFYPGAKIGVLGRNGSGKSTLLRIMAGIDKEFDGEAQADRRASPWGCSTQEPHLNPDEGRPRQHRGGGRRHAGAAQGVRGNRRQVRRGRRRSRRDGKA